MRLSQKENLVLQSVILQARHSTEQIARQIGVPHHVVRRIVSKLIDQNVLLGVRAYVNPYPLGLQAYQVHFSMLSTSPEKHSKLIGHLSQRDGVSLLAELSGDPQYEMHFFARDSRDAVALIDSLIEQTPEVKIDSLALTHEQHYSGVLGYLMRHSSEYKPLRYGAITESISINELDHTLLGILANESVESHRALAQRLKMPTSTISYRVQSLESRGLIAGYYHLCDFKPLGLLPAVGLLYTSTLDSGTRAKLIAFCNSHPGIAYVDVTVGPFSARVFMRAHSYDEARQIMSDLRGAFSESIQSIRILPQLRFMRHSTYPFTAT